ncbi:tumor necrosis factor-like [Haliotis cracherodii]|uniref:tumor necrosis factor-like n=1 Tax=Haliotis cracherodii TaxID=6455 RepID=UPI0039EC979B
MDCDCQCTSERNKTATKWTCLLSCLFILNILTGVVVAALVTHRTLSSNLESQNLTGSEWKSLLDEVYESMLMNGVSTTHTEHDDGDNGDDHPDLQFLNLLKPVAHFSGLKFDIVTTGHWTQLKTLRNWANPDGSYRKLLYNGMSYENGSITVPAAGVYHITSHVKFYVEDNRKDDKPLQTFQHQVVRYSASSQTQVVLFENAVTECKDGINDGAHMEYPSDADGLAQLDAGDQVMVKVSHLQTLKHDRDWHYVDIHIVYREV